MVSRASSVSQKRRQNTLKAKNEIIRQQAEKIKELEKKDEETAMKELLKAAQQKLDDACKGVEDVCSIRYYMGYAQAIRDVNKKLRLEGLEELEAGD
jgi:gamma-glutamyl phosphate reductase